MYEFDSHSLNVQGDPPSRLTAFPFSIIHLFNILFLEFFHVLKETIFSNNIFLLQMTVL